MEKKEREEGKRSLLHVICLSKCDAFSPISSLPKAAYIEREREREREKEREELNSHTHVRFKSVQTFRAPHLAERYT